MILRGWANATALLAGMKIRVKGTPPRAPFLLVSNHLSYMDVVAFAARVDSRFVAKSDVARWPVLGLLSRNMGTLFVDRHSRKDVLRVNALIQRTLADGRGVLLFPEGTSTAGVEVLPFHSALLEPAVQAGYPVSYATISYETHRGETGADQSVCWWGDMTFLGHLYGLFQLTSFDVTLQFGSHSIRSDNRKMLAKSLWQAVQANFIPGVRTEEPCSTSIR